VRAIAEFLISTPRAFVFIEPKIPKSTENLVVSIMAERPSLRRKWPSLALVFHLAIFMVISHAIHLDIHVPLPSDDCLMTQTLRANELLRSFSRIQNVSTPNDENDVPAPLEQVDLFSLHTPHITLFLADFDLELDHNHIIGKDELGQLNTTKVDSFLETISTINFTNVIHGLECKLSLSTESFIGLDNLNHDDKYYTINGAFTMLIVQNSPCLKKLSDTILHTVESFVKRPVIVPSWVASLPEPQRSAAIYRSRKYGSPNVFEGFLPHLTVGFDPPTVTNAAVSHHHSLRVEQTSRQWREDAMKQWNEGFKLVKDRCSSKVKGIAVGKNSLGGTVLANSRMKFWSVGGHEEQIVIRE